MKCNTQTFKLVSGLLLAGVLSAAAVPVTFEVDMSVQIDLGAFTPGADTISMRGEVNSWGGGGQLVLTNDPGGANPAIYSGTVDDTAAVGSTRYFKYVKTVGTTDRWEDDPNRSYVLAGSPQTVPLVYFNSQAPSTGVPTHAVTFQADMSVQITKGAFDPVNDLVEARGVFQTPFQWTGGFTLTNSPANPKLYKNTYPDANYLGTSEGWKLVIVKGGTSYQWESGSNRGFTLLSDGQVLDPVYFNNEFPVATLVVFQVDMSLVPLFNPATFVVEARGSFQSPSTWSGGFFLTNTPSQPYIFSGIYTNYHLSGTVEEYKFTWTDPADPGSTVHWEGINNRSFTLGSGTQVLPLTTFNNVNVYDVLTADTTVTFSVDMNNAKQYSSGTPFDPSLGDEVYLNGDFLGWWSWGSAPSAYRMTETPPTGSKIYSLQLLLPRGTPLRLTYKYGINSSDNEAGFGTNHVRYVRALGTYSLPPDTFSLMTGEPEVGSLAIAPPAGGKVLVSWLGRPGVRLQTATGIADTWSTLAETDGLSSTNYPVGPGQTFFRLIKP